MATYQPRDINLQDAVTWIAEGRVRLPEFQRPFEWGLSDQRSLLDSIQKAYPVGTLLLLEVGNKEAPSPFGQRPFEGVAEPAARDAELLVLDGQQRLSSCYRAFSSGYKRVFCIDLAKLYEVTGGAAGKPVDLDDLIVVRARPPHVESLLHNRNLLPFEFLTNRDGLREKLATYRSNLAKKPETEDFGRFVELYLQGYVDIFFDYRFPAIVLPADLDIEAVANVFTKINTTGQRLSAFDLCVATLFPKEKTHYLNILHAGWPGGLIFGGLASYFLAGQVRWEIQMSLFLVPAVLYGLMMLAQKFPESEAKAAGTSFGETLSNFAAPVLLFLLFIHAMVGYVELGTDSWISKITGSIMADPKKGLLLFVYTSGLMFVLRFFAGPIVHRISPLGLLFVSGLLGCAGLSLLGRADGVAMCIVAATVYACGKTFLWPTMLGVASEQFPRGGAVTLGAMGGIGMLSAGLLGGPGIGFKQDYFASQELAKTPAIYDRYKAEKENSFLMFKTQGLDGAKVGVIGDDGKALAEDIKKVESDPKNGNKELVALNTWWTEASKSKDTDKKPVESAVLFGSKQALIYTAFVPLAMALCYLLLILYFKARGGYKQVHLDHKDE